MRPRKGRYHFTSKWKPKISTHKKVDKPDKRNVYEKNLADRKFIVVVFKNGKKYRELKFFRKKQLAYKFYLRLVEKSNKVLLAKENECLKDNNRRKTKVKYHITLLQIRKKPRKRLDMIRGDHVKTFRDFNGKNILIKLDNHDVLYADEYFIESEFVYLNVNKKVYTDEIYYLLFDNALDKQIYYYKKYLIVQMENDFHVFKHTINYEIYNLYNTLLQICKLYNRLSNLFTGEINPNTKTEILEKIKNQLQIDL